MQSSLTLGVDIGGTKINAGLVTRTGKIMRRLKVPTDVSAGKKGVLANIERCIASLWFPGIKAIGVGMAGIVDVKKGIYLQGPNLPAAFRNIPLAALLKARFKVPVTIDNDVHCFTLAEAIFGSAKGLSSVVGITLGTGIGGGIVIDGKLHRGKNNAAGELGHMAISSSDAVCGCGMTGHFEALASGSAMAKLYKKETGRELDSFGVEKAAADGDTAAKKVLGMVAASAGIGLANVLQMFDPDMIVIGGGLIRVKALWSPMLAETKRRVIYRQLKKTPIVRSSLGDDANILGAALLTGKLH